MRLFIGTEVILKDYLNLKMELSPYIKGNWTKSSNLHITHKFIGEDEPVNWEINLDVPKEKIKISGFGIFDDKVLYLKADSEHIDSIAKQLNVKNFVPHITICRMKSYQKKPLFEALKKIKIDQEIDFNLYLYKSTLTPNGPIYEKIYKYG